MLICAQFYVVWWNFALSCPVSPGRWIIPLSNAHPLASSHLSYYVTMPTSLTSLHHWALCTLTSSQAKLSIVKLERESDHIHMALWLCIATVVHYIVIVFNFLPCLIYTLNVVRHVCIRKNTVNIGFKTICGFKHPLGIWGCIPYG
jgi:hypothetical protein